MTEFRPVIDLPPALARLGEDRELLCDLARFYLQDAPQLLMELQVALTEENSEAVARSAHSLKGLSANFDAHDAVDAARSVEQSAMAGDLEGAAARVPRLRDEVSLVQTALHDQLLAAEDN